MAISGLGDKRTTITKTEFVFAFGKLNNTTFNLVNSLEDYIAFNNLF